MPRSDCPVPSRLRDLLDNALSQSDAAGLTEHLDGCPSCQCALEDLAAAGTNLLRVAPAARQSAPAHGAAYWQALSRAQAAVAVAEAPSDVTRPAPASDHGPRATDESLPFLRPAEDPEFLGRIGHFLVVGVIGRGGMGVVLRALDRCLQRFVAIKVLHPELAGNEMAHKRFCREARAAAAVTHESVVAIHEVDEDEDTGLPFLVMHLVTGTSLEDHINKNGALPLADVVRFGAQAASGLAAAHEKGLIHRDVKPANILLEGDLRRAKISDFGLARATEDVRLTQTGFVPGTPLYMAPEQARGEAVDHRADLFSLGSVLYAMTTGRPPFQGNTPYVVLKSVTEEQPLPIRSLAPHAPDWLIAIIQRLHAKRPEDRFPSAAEVAEVLHHRLAEMVSSAPAPHFSRPRRGRLAFVVGLVVGVLGTLLVTELTGASQLVNRLLGR